MLHLRAMEVEAAARCIERSMNLTVVKRIVESTILVAGEQAVETALSVHLEKYFETLGTRVQLAISEFEDALLIIPKILA